MVAKKVITMRDLERLSQKIIELILTISPKSNEKEISIAVVNILFQCFRKMQDKT